MNKALRISSCSISSSKSGQTNDGNTITLSKDSDNNVGIWRRDMDLSLHGLDMSIDGAYSAIFKFS